MKALTVRQPYASLIVEGLKTVEVRTWRTNYRGPLLITSSAKAMPPAVFEGLDRDDDGMNGYALGIVELFDIRIMQYEDWSSAWVAAPRLGGVKPYAWRLRNHRTIEPTPIKGRLGLWDAPQFTIWG